MMRRLVVLLAVAVMMAAMMVASALPALARSLGQAPVQACSKILEHAPADVLYPTGYILAGCPTGPSLE
jgi:hypothetical protein